MEKENIIKEATIEQYMTSQQKQWKLKTIE